MRSSCSGTSLKADRVLWDEGADRGEACGPKERAGNCEKKDEIATKAELVKVRLRGAQ